jgi:hypothetical protein
VEIAEKIIGLVLFVAMMAMACSTHGCVEAEDPEWTRAASE